MKKGIQPSFILLMIFMFMFSVALAKDYVIYSIVQDIPMGEPNEVVKKNYYLNMGSSQGLQNGNKVDVYRRIFRVNPYNNNKKSSYKVKIGELEILHSEEESSIARLEKIDQGIQVPLFETNSPMIGDAVEVHIKK